MNYAKIKEVYLREGIIKNIECSVKEKPTSTFLGSTDKKGYTIEIHMMYLGESSKAYTHIEPWYSKEIVDSMIERAKEEATFKFANILLPKLLTA